MVDRTYGYKRLRENPLFDSTLKTAEVMDSDSAQVLIGMVYDVAFDIHNHYSPQSTNPLATVEMHDREDYYKKSGLYRAIERFHSQDVYNRFGLSLEEYLSLPRDVIDSITDVIIEANQRMESIEHQERNKHHDSRPGTAWGSPRK